MCDLNGLNNSIEQHESGLAFETTLDRASDRKFWMLLMSISDRARAVLKVCQAHSQAVSHSVFLTTYMTFEPPGQAGQFKSCMWSRKWSGRRPGNEAKLFILQLMKLATISESISKLQFLFLFIQLFFVLLQPFQQCPWVKGSAPVEREWRFTHQGDSVSRSLLVLLLQTYLHQTTHFVL